MYYNSHKSNSNYYNSYKKEISKLEAYKRAEKREMFIKIFLSLFIMSLLLIAAFYLYKYFNPNFDLKNSSLKSNRLKSITIKEEQLPVSIQVKESTMHTVQISNATTKPKKLTNINEKDITLIVQTVMSQMNTKVEKPLEEQLNEVDNKTFVTKNLEEENHYNKVVLAQNKPIEVENNSLVLLSNELNNIIDAESDNNSNYTEEIEKEMIVRENEMRVIIVQQGDTLSKIAERAYGHYTDYTKIFAANPEIIKNPNQIFVGQRLRIPS